jgi:RNA-binding motif X-linked protein 2
MALREREREREREGGRERNGEREREREREGGGERGEKCVMRCVRKGRRRKVGRREANIWTNGVKFKTMRTNEWARISGTKRAASPNQFLTDSVHSSSTSR